MRQRPSWWPADPGGWPVSCVGDSRQTPLSRRTTRFSALADEAGPKAGEVRDQLVEELKRWRRDPIKDKKARKELAKQMVEGPPGPQRAAWTAAETALGRIAAAVAKKAIDRFLTDEPAKGDRAAAATAAARAKASSTAHNTAAGPGPEDYAGWSKPT